MSATSCVERSLKDAAQLLSWMALTSAATSSSMAWCAPHGCEGVRMRRGTGTIHAADLLLGNVCVNDAFDSLLLLHGITDTPRRLLGLQHVQVPLP